MRPGHVPTAVVGPLVSQLVEERWPDGGGYDVLGEKVGCHRDTIEGIVSQRSPGVDFDLADGLLAALGRPDLCPYPDSFWLTCALPSCQRRFVEIGSGPKKKRYCSPQCTRLATLVKQGKATGERLRQHGYCLRGHKITAENSIRGRCRICNRQRQKLWAREWRRRHGARPRFQEAT